MIESAELVKILESAEVWGVDVLPEVNREADVARIDRIFAAPFVIPKVILDVPSTPIQIGQIVELSRLEVRRL